MFTENFFHCPIFKMQMPLKVKKTVFYTSGAIAAKFVLYDAALSIIAI